MKPETISEIQAASREPLPFLYFEDRESPWLLSRLMPGPARIAEIRRAPYGKLVDRPAVRPVVAQCGGLLDPCHLASVADPEAALAPGAEGLRNAATLAGLAEALGGALTAYSVTLGAWTEEMAPVCWEFAQMSRRGGNLVLQVNFPESHNDALDASLGIGLRDQFECGNHPIRTGSGITMAWARIDFDPGGEEALIEELQSDWFRMARSWGRYQRKRSGRRRNTTPAGVYLQEVMPRYERNWERVLLLAALWFIEERLGIRRIYLHRPRTGTRLKRIRGCPPPVSLYTDLPRRFCFEATNDAPEFLMRARGKAVRNLRRSGRPVFWRLAL